MTEINQKAVDQRKTHEELLDGMRQFAEVSRPLVRHTAYGTKPIPSFRIGPRNPNVFGRKL